MNDDEKTEPATTEELLAQISQVLVQRRFWWTRETDLQDGIAAVLNDCGVSFEREKRLTEGERTDFWSSPVAIEVKVKGSLSEVTRQLMRYADVEEVEAVVLVTTKMQHRRMPPTMRGKPLKVVYLSPL